MSLAWVTSPSWCKLAHKNSKNALNRFRNSRTCASLSVRQVDTIPIPGQKTGTSGLRKKTSVLVENENFLCNWVQSLFDSIGQDELLGKTLVIGGDGRYYNVIAAQKLIQMAAANGLAKVVIGQNGVMSTPAVSAAIIGRQAYGGIIMTASHNPGGIDGDWGIKYNVATGSPATEILLDRVYEKTTTINSYKVADLPHAVDLTSLGVTSFPSSDFVVEVVSSTEDHVKILKECFDFDKLREFLRREDFGLCYDAMNAAGGPCATRIIVEELGAPATSVINNVPLEDFGGIHPDPNLTYATELLGIMNPTKNSEAPDLGAASDGDGDRNMILGRGFFVTPSDSLAVITDYAQDAIPFFKDGLRGLARSMPTSGAVDRVAEAKGLTMYETPTGWKYFGNLMDSGQLSICGEESFGIGSNHIREKDGVWAVLAWLSILAFRNEDTSVWSLIGVEQIVKEHWAKYGRNFYTRYDYEGVSSEDADLMMQHLRYLIASDETKQTPDFNLLEMDEFSYIDPVDGSSASQQGVRILFEGGTRIIVRLSGTGSAGATIRIYLELFESDTTKHTMATADVMQPLVDLALQFTRVQEFTGRNAPTVIT